MTRTRAEGRSHTPRAGLGSGTLAAGRRAAAGVLAGLLAGPSLGCPSAEAPPSGGSTGSTSGAATLDATLGAEASAGPIDGSTSPGEVTDTSTGEPEGGWGSALEVGTDVGAFYSVWGPEPGLVYAVAGQSLAGGLSTGSLHRFGGAQWAAAPLPPDLPALHWVFGVGSRRVIVGDFGVVLMRDGDEGEWTQHGCSTILPLWGVWGAGPDDLWAVGGDGFLRDPVACHFDGRAWTQAELPELSFESHALYKVWGTATDDVWAVGDDGLLMHYGGEGEGWVEVPSGTDFDLISLWGTGPDEILAVGGRTTGVLARWDGMQWSTAEVPALLGLNGVWMAPDGTATVVGPQGGLGVVAPGALAVEVEDADTPLALHGVFGFAEVERWAVGGSFDMAPPYVGVIVRREP